MAEQQPGDKKVEIVPHKEYKWIFRNADDSLYISARSEKTKRGCSDGKYQTR